MKRIKLKYLFIFLFAFILENNVTAQQWIVYRDTNSGLPYNGLVKVKIDRFGNKWILDGHGELVKFDGTSWTVYNHTNSGLPYTGLSAIAIDRKDNKWLATSDSGLVKFDDTNWTIYTKSNSCLTSNVIYDCDVDSSNNVWLATDSGIIKFDTGSHCTFYNTSNGSLIFDRIDELKIDSRNWVWAINHPETNPWGYINIFNGSTWQNNQGVPWGPYFVIPEHIFCDSVGNVWGSAGMGILKYNGIAFSVPYDSSITTAVLYYISAVYANSKLIACASEAQILNYFNDTTWSTYRDSNSPLYGYIADITCDRYNNLWIAGENGLYEFNPNGIVVGLIEYSDLNLFVVNSYPNPSSRKLHVEVKTVSDLALNFSLSDEYGREVKCTYQVESRTKGTKVIIADLQQLNDGMYFYRVTTDKAINAGKVLLIKNQ